MRQAVSDVLTPREREEFEQEKEAAQLGYAHAERMKRLELEVVRLEARWSSWLKLPKFIILLPVYIIMAIAYCIAVARKQPISPDFWKFMK